MLKEVSSGDENNSIFIEWTHSNLQYCIDTLQKDSEESIDTLLQAAEANY